MASIFENQDRRVVPNWRSFRKTATLGELDNVRKISNTHPTRRITIEDYVEDWLENKTIAHAGDLLSSALVNGIWQDKNVLEAANFILENQTKSALSQVSLAKSLTSQGRDSLLHRLENTTIDEFDKLVKRELIWSRVKKLKQNISRFPFNAISYVELARNYSVIGQRDKALHAMKIALNLAPLNRFILRCAARLFAHYEDVEFAHDILRKSPLTSGDPWLTSAEISMATLRDRSSRFIKKGLEMVNSNNLTPFSITELASALGTVELIEGSIKKSRALFNKSLISPNDNSLAQIEWASSKETLLRIDTRGFQAKHNFEAIALDNFHNSQYQESLNDIFRWFLDMPFSKRPIMLGSHIANSFLDDQETSRAFLRAGLISHPNDHQLINNLVYSLALENKLAEAMELMRSVPDNPAGAADITKICLTATRGLLCFRNGVSDMGRSLYLDAIEKATVIKNVHYNWLAILNYAREEILIKSEHAEKIMETVGKIPDNAPEAEINKLKKEVVALYLNSKENEEKV